MNERDAVITVLFGEAYHKAVWIKYPAGSYVKSRCGRVTTIAPSIARIGYLTDKIVTCDGFKLLPEIYRPCRKCYPHKGVDAAAEIE